MSDPDFTVRAARWPEDSERIREVREVVFVQEQNVPSDLEWDGLDEACVHALAETADGRAIGTGRLLDDGRIGRMAVLEEFRGRGVGDAILKLLLDEAREAGIARTHLHSQVHALGFYLRHGFIADGDEFEEADIPHQTMVLELGPRITLDGWGANLRAAVRVAACASRSLALLTRDLDPQIYNNEPFLEEMRRVALAGRYARVRILVQDSARAAREGHRLVDLARRLPTYIELRKPHEDHRNVIESFLVADEQALLYRKEADRYEGFADLDNAFEARRLLRTFDEIWNRATPDAEMRRLRI